MKKMAFHKAVSIVSGLALAITSLMPGNFALAETSQGDVPPCGTVNFVDNGSFETPVVTNPANWDIYPGDSVAVPNWKADWNGTFEGAPKPANIELQKFPLNNWTAQDGQQWTELDTDWGGPGDSQNGEPASIKLYQDVSVTYGARYTLSFYTSPRPGTGQDDNITKIEWGGTTLDTITEDGSLLTTPDWKLHTYTVTATAAPMMLAFTDMGTPNSLGGFLDNVTLKQVCVPQNCNFEQKSGWYGEYFNYPSNHPDMNLDPSFWPDVTHGDPMNWTDDTDWYTDPYMRFTRIDASLTFGDNFFPFDGTNGATPLEEDNYNGRDYHFGAHWTSKVIAPADGEYDFTLMSDDDAWLYLDGVLVGDNSGIHAPESITGTLSLTTAPKILDVYFAERHIVQSYLSLTFSQEGLRFVPYNRACPEKPKKPPVATLEKTGEYDHGNVNSLGQITYKLNWAITGEGSLNNVTITDPLPTGTHFVSADNDGTLEAGDIVTWDLGTKSAGNSGTVSFIVSLDGAFASSVVSTDQGTRKDGTPVIPARSIPENTLGAPQSTGADFDTSGVPENQWFYSLGFPTETKSASITLKFDNPVMNGPGQDLRVFEVTYGPGSGYPMERANVEVSQDLSTWIDLPGEVNRDGIAHLPDDIPFIKYVRLTDVSDKKLFEDTADGYDVDAVLALHPSICEVNNTAAFTGNFQQTEKTVVPVIANAEFLLTINQDACVPTVRVAKEGSYNSQTNEITYTINWSVGGKGTLYNVVVTDKVPAGTTYVEESASDPDNAGPLIAGGLVSGEVKWLLGDQASGASGTLTFKVTVDSAEAWADHVVSFRQGNRWDGTPVVEERSHPEKALGEAERDDTVNFVSLGFGEIKDNLQYGELVLKFDNYILNGPGVDIEVVETSYGSPSDSAYPETVELFVSQDGINWISLGQGIQDEMFSFESGSVVLPWAKYVKLVDRSDKSKFSNSTTTDGYDVDGVRAIYPGAGECSIDNTVKISGEVTPNELWQITVPNIEAEATTTTSINPYACVGTITGYKFNDRDGNGWWNGEGETGLPDWVIKAVLPTPVATIEVPSNIVDGVNSPILPAGQYLMKVTGDWQGAAGVQNRVDAEYVTHDYWLTYKDGTFDYPTGGVDQGDLLIDNNFIDWGPYGGNETHVYYRNLNLEQAGPINFSVFDGNAITHEKVPGWYGDNVGNLQVTIYQVVDETVTGPDGSYALAIPSQYPNVWVFEIPQRGWRQTAPDNIYYPIDLSTDKTHDGLNFGNQGLVGAVSGMKFNDKDSDGVKDKSENGLGKWTIYASKFIQELEVDSHGEVTGTPIWSAPLTLSKEYVIRVADTFDAGDYITADAKYSFRSLNSTEWTDIVKNYESYGPALLDLHIDDVAPNWGVYNSNHIYWRTVMGTGATLKFQIYDIYASNDVGKLKVGIYEVIDKQITDDTGYYHFDLSGAYGNVMISEQTQDGWLETLPTPDGYYLVSTDKNYTDKDFGNHYTVQLPGSVTGMKFNDHNSDGVKDKNDGGLVGWKIYAGQLLDTLEVDSYYEDPELPALTHSNFVLENGQKYFLRVSQTFLAGDSITADTKYSIRTGPDWTDIVENYGGYEPGLLEIWMDSALVNWGAFNSSNVYWHTVVGNGNPLYFYIKDIYPINNSGKLKVEIFKVLAETTTVADGSYNLVLPDELSGNVVVAEETQTGWTQTYLMPLGYYTVSADGVTEDINFGNHQLVEEQGGEGGDNGDNGGVTGRGSSGGGGSYYNPGGGTTPPVVINPKEEGVGGGEVAGEEIINPAVGTPTAGSPRKLALGTGDEGSLQDQGDVLGEATTANDDQKSQAGSGWWKVAAYIMIPLLLILLIIYGIYKWMNRRRRGHSA